MSTDQLSFSLLNLNFHKEGLCLGLANTESIIKCCFENTSVRYLNELLLERVGVVVG
jgi:hypothetical protein